MVRRTGARGARAAVLALLGGVAAAAVVVGTQAPASGDAGRSELARVKAATAKFHDVAVAKAAGYVPVSPCEELPGSGAMGVHYLNPALAADGEVDPLRPEVLLYLPSEDGPRLAGVEWFVAEAATGGQRPYVLGQPFEGPMDGHGPGMPRHYDKHAWLWAHNPAGTWEPWNPALTCSTED